jgi:hypothetical protein
MAQNENRNDKNFKNREHFKRLNYERLGISLTYSIIHFIVFIIAIVLAVRCGAGILGFVVAIFCPYIYVIYALIKYRGFCGKK